MGRKRNWGRSLNGILLLNKNTGETSNAVLQQAKKLFFAAKAGHTGSLDPLATGVLPICFGEATKFSQYLLDADKRYLSTFRLGIATETGDADGEVIEQRDASTLTEKQVAQAMVAYRGDIEQIPSMYSALKYQGQPLYKLARQGIEVERQPRPVSIYSYELLAFRAGSVAEVDVVIHCSKGTYVRCMAEDLGRDLHCGAHVSRLHRSASGPFNDSCAVTLEELSAERGDGLAEILDHHLLPVDAAVVAYPQLELSEQSAFYFRRGQAVMEGHVYRLGDQGDTVRVCTNDGEFLGLGEITDDGRVTPRRLVSGAA